ncbi:DUF1425 domain-containing protein [Crenobacter luteus]|uniref:DUF1425 domain-containing protein n=1 Tax=Crenobacter luteus TaxID=1452487 RepID=A0A165FHA4_9NEIS|nr:DUF1425 domain-containing protein [Crenobacter luteus]KZE33269.1 hypothetical protein AVW16_08870 [Crenobacter luteus]
MTRIPTRWVTALALATGLVTVLPAQADSVASKTEPLGKMDNVKVDTIRLVRRNGLLNIQAEFVNQSSKNQVVFYRFKWLDDSGFSTWGEEVWKPITLYGTERKLLTEVAPTPNTTDFRLQLQSPENTVR